MNLLMISEYYPPDQVGASTRISILIKELRKFHDITLITSFPHYPKPENQKVNFLRPIQVMKKKHLTIIRIWMPVLNMNSSIGRILDYSIFTVLSIIGFPFVSKKPDIIWGTSPNVFCGFTAKLAKICFGGLALANIDDVWPEGPAELGFLKSNTLRWMGEILSKASVTGMDAITTISQTISWYYKKKYDVQNIFTIPVGFDNKKLEYFIRTSKYGKNEGNTTFDKKITFMYSGILGPAYDFELLIKAFSLIEDKSNFQLVIRGTGPLKGYIERLLKKYRLTNASFETQYLSIEDLHKRLQSADVFILPMVNNFISKTALPTKLFEYMSIGRPILLYGKGEPKKLVENANAGIICIEGGASKYADSIRSMIKSPLKEEWGRNGQLFIKSQYSSRIIGSIVNSMFETLLKTKIKNK